jgi:hypothetical protein
MRIAATEVTLASSHASTARREVQESLRAWVGPRRPDFEGRERARVAVASSPPPRSSKVPEKAASAGGSVNDQAIDDAVSDPLLQLLRTMIEAMTGVRVKIYRPEDVPRGEAPPELVDPRPAPAATPARGPAGFGVEYDYHEVREETEATAFAASGVVRTSEGQEIEFQVALAMSRSYREETNLSLRQGDARRKDPLVINFSGTAAELVEQRFAFDLEGDGTVENLPGLAGGSGFLVFDRNADGQVNDGRELFGPQSGEGFRELAALDQDRNGWIDEGDAAYSRLYAWSPDPEGGGALRSLGALRIGALAVQGIATPFELRTASNVSLGVVRSTGVYLAEDGAAGTVQQFDLSV